MLVSEFEGLHFNEPNDLTVDAQDGLYFTDPNYKHHGQETVRKEDAYYLSADGKVTRVSTVCQKPNGILLTPDGKMLYLADNRGKAIYRYDVKGPGQLANETRWADLTGGPDGMTLDERGNLYIGCGPAGVKVYSPEGQADWHNQRPLRLEPGFRRPRFHDALHYLGGQVPVDQNQGQRHETAGGVADWAQARGLFYPRISTNFTNQHELIGEISRSIRADW